MNLFLKTCLNSAIVESRAKLLMNMLEEIITYLMEKWASNKMIFPYLSDEDVLLNIKKKVERTNTFTNLWIVR